MYVSPWPHKKGGALRSGLLTLLPKYDFYGSAMNHLELSFVLVVWSKHEGPDMTF